MDASAVLERLTALGVTITPRPNGNLWLEPASKIPADVLEMVRQHKGEIMTALHTQASLPVGALGLLDRLRKGATFLMDAHKTLLETGERYTKLEERFLAGIDLFDSLDSMLRSVYPDYKGCVLAPGPCPGDAPVRCRFCAGMVVTETGEQRYA